MGIFWWEQIVEETRIIDGGCAMVDVRGWMCDGGCEMSDVGCEMLDVRCSMCKVRCQLWEWFKLPSGCKRLPVLLCAL